MKQRKKWLARQWHTSKHWPLHISQFSSHQKLLVWILKSTYSCMYSTSRQKLLVWILKSTCWCMYYICSVIHLFAYYLLYIIIYSFLYTVHSIFNSLWFSQFFVCLFTHLFLLYYISFTFPPSSFQCFTVLMCNIYFVLCVSDT